MYIEFIIKYRIEYSNAGVQRPTVLSRADCMRGLRAASRRTSSNCMRQIKTGLKRSGGWVSLGTFKVQCYCSLVIMGGQILEACPGHKKPKPVEFSVKCEASRIDFSKIVFTGIKTTPYVRMV